jgi:hypothetical protein
MDREVFEILSHYLAILNRRDSPLTLTREIARRGPGGGTNFHAIFEQAKVAPIRALLMGFSRALLLHLPDPA